MILELTSGIFVLGVLIYCWSISTYNFWHERGVPGPKPVPLLGNISDLITGKKSVGQLVQDYYNDYKNEKMVGLFFRREPILLLRDLDLIKDIFISDFSKFSDRPMRVFEKAEPLSQTLLHLEYARWRPLRNKLSPVFTSGKLKDMFNLILNCGDNLQTVMDKIIDKNNIIEARDLTARFTIDVIGVCAFGLEINAMNDDDNKFRKMGKRVFHMSFKKILLFQLRELFPSIYEFLGSIVDDTEVTNFFINTMRDTMNYRRKNNLTRNDFLQYLMEIEDNPDKLPEIKLTDSFLASQLFIFFLAGFETSSSTISHALYELAQYENYQDQLRQEIKETKEANGGKWTYDSVKNMVFMEKVFRETLRKFSPIPMLIRGSNTEYTLSGTNVTIPKNSKIAFPVYGIHYDPKIYPNPEVFNPENFSPEAIQSRHPMSFLSFGEGPRNCVGMRFAYQQSKVGLIKILERYRVDVCDKTDIPYKFSTRGFSLEPLNGIYLKFTKLDNSSSK
ncbi:probable cytochrome P450 6a13 [Aphidius gifuensis]|uniref:probable cytochrome P450 6a13 n=1 Tax=Aphidius gifuensis TaxID=684658 RepID=UPI001CDD11F7|nr:probable cytochrome P450 6a13 [Aphidius gifuensis]